MRAFLGVDLGTSSLKATLVDETGQVRGGAEAAYSVSSPRSGWAETDPRVWAEALATVRRDLATALPMVEPAGIGFAGQMHGVVLVDAHAVPVRPAMLWPDLRATDVLPRWEGLSVEVRGRLANPLVAGVLGPMVTWLARHEPEVLASTATVLAPKDWLRSRLTGDRVTERSDASATLVWDLLEDDWSQPAVRLAGLSPDQLPAVRGGDEIVGTANGVPVTVGGADVACALTALDAVAALASTDALRVIIGSGIQVVRPGVTPQPRVDPATHLFADTAGGWYEMVGVRNGGLSLDWVQRVLKLSWSALVAAARSARPGEVLFVPFVTGERGHVAPVAPRAGWVGLRQRTGVPELARSAFEALGFTVRRSMELLGHDDGPVVLSGGGVREPFVRQLVADCVGRPMVYVPLRSASAVGAALLAARAVGTDMRLGVEPVTVIPRPSAQLDSAYARWQQVVWPAVSGR